MALSTTVHLAINTTCMFKSLNIILDNYELRLILQWG